MISVDEPLFSFPFFKKINEISNVKVASIAEFTTACLRVVFPVALIRAAFVVVPAPHSVL